MHSACVLGVATQPCLNEVHKTLPLSKRTLYLQKSFPVLIPQPNHCPISRTNEGVAAMSHLKSKMIHHFPRLYQLPYLLEYIEVRFLQLCSVYWTGLPRTYSLILSEMQFGSTTSPHIKEAPHYGFIRTGDYFRQLHFCFQLFPKRAFLTFLTKSVWARLATSIQTASRLECLTLPGSKYLAVFSRARYCPVATNFSKVLSFQPTLHHFLYPFNTRTSTLRITKFST